MVKKKHVGRPKLPAAERRDEIIEIRLSKAEKKALTKAAGDSGVSTWLRDLALMAAGVKR